MIPALFASCGDYLQEITDQGVLAVAAKRAEEHAAAIAPTTPAMIFEVVVIVGAIVAYVILSRCTTKVWQRAGVMAVGVFLFELFTAPMWVNNHLGWWAYIYCDVSWVLTLGWTTLILSTVVLVDYWLPNWSEPKRFAFSLLCLTGIVLVAEIAVVALGIRSYAPEVMATISGYYLLDVPIEVLYYVPVFTALVIAFYKYWMFVIDDVALVPVKKRKWLRAIAIAFVVVFLFELVVEPMVNNENFPSWSYVYRDVSIVMTGIWVLLIAITAVIVNRYLLFLPIPLRFAAALLVMSLLVFPIEAWLIANGYRVYGESAAMNFTGYKVPLADVAIEVAFAIPCYLALIVASIRYWEIVIDNRL